MGPCGDQRLAVALSQAVEHERSLAELADLELKQVTQSTGSPDV